MKNDITRQGNGLLDEIWDMFQAFKDEHPHLVNCIVWGGIALIGIAGVCTEGAAIIKGK